MVGEPGNGGVTDHTALDNLNSSSYTHLTAAQALSLTSGGSTTLHFHPSDNDSGDYTNSAALLALSGVTPAADTVPYFTSTTAAATTSLTAYSRTLLDDANAGAWRTTLGLGVLATQGDGDKGDITVSASGATWTVDASAITYAKIQNVSATDRLLGRSTAGAGVVEEITCTSFARSLLDDSSAATARSTLGIGSSDTPTFSSVTAKDYVASTALTNSFSGYTAQADTTAIGGFRTYSSAIGATAFGVTINNMTLLYSDGAASLGLAVGTGNSAPLILGTNNTERMRIAADGSVSVEGALTADSLADSKGDVRTIPQNSKSADYTLALSDAGKHILHPSADTTGRTFTIPANSSVAFPIGTAVTFVNQASAGNITIAITTDTMRLAGAGTTGSRTLAANGIATAIKVTSTEWLVSGTNLT